MPHARLRARTLQRPAGAAGEEDPPNEAEGVLVHPLYRLCPGGWWSRVGAYIGSDPHRLERDRDLACKVKSRKLSL